VEAFGSRNLGPYRLIASLGSGGQADVFLAVRRGPAGFSRLIVLKSIRQEMADDPRFREALLAEARLAARLHHPNVVQTLEVGEEAGHLYIAMEFLDGQPLNRVVKSAWLAGRPPPVPISAAILSDMLAGLHAAHELRDFDGRPLEVIHRDVSPQNVFLTYEGEVKLVDFGIAKAATSAEVTDTGIIKGKAAYLAPEQALGQSIDRRADVYAAGIVGWELLSGHRLSRATTAAASAKAFEEPAATLASVAAAVPPPLAAVIDRALQRERDQRFATARQMREALLAALEGSGLRVATREELGQFVSSLFERERRWLQQRIQETVLASEREPQGESTPPSLPQLQPPSLETPRSPGAGTNALPRRRGRRLLAAITAGAVIAAAAAVLLWQARTPAWGSGDLRLCGSNTIGAELAPALVEAFLRHKGAGVVERTPGAAPQQTSLRARGLSRPLAVSIESLGSSTAFRELAEGRCDVGMASRAPREEERALLMAKGLGDLRAHASEHVLALDGIAVIVHPNNPVRALDLDRLRAIFSGAVRDWSGVGGAAGGIDVLVRDANSGTYDTFEHLVLRGAALAPGAVRLSDSFELSDRVAGDARSIGFVGLAYIRSAAAVSVAGRGGRATLPTAFTVSDESYPLSRRLYLYTLARPRTPLAVDLVGFALSAAGQQIVRQAGFVDLLIGVRAQEGCAGHCSKEYAAAVRGARRLSFDLRFREGGAALDSRALKDLDRLVAFLRSNPPARLLLLGFAGGDSHLPARVAALRHASLVAAELEHRGVRAAMVQGIGASPDAPGDDRVEVWIREGR
jgi:serine/threonine-protein kinase